MRKILFLCIEKLIDFFRFSHIKKLTDSVDYRCHNNSLSRIYRVQLAQMFI